MKWIFFKLLSCSRLNPDEKITTFNDIFPKIWIDLFIACVIIRSAVFIHSTYSNEKYIFSASLAHGLELQLQYQFGEEVHLWSLLQYTWSIILGIWVLIGVYCLMPKIYDLSLFTLFKYYINSGLVELYVNLPYLAFSLHFISPTLLLLAYGYDNIDYVSNSIYYPLYNAVAPIMTAKAALKQHKQGIGANDENFLIDNQTIAIAEQTLNEHAASVVGAAAEVHTVFQIFITAMLSDGSPYIVVYILSNLIALNGITKIWAWFPKQTKKVVSWAQSGMQTDLRVLDMWEEFQKLHLNNALFWLTDYIIALIWFTDDRLRYEWVITMLCLGPSLWICTKYISGGIYFTEGKIIAMIITATPLIFNYVTGPSLFNVAVWLSVTGYRNPDQIWEYLNYAMVLISILIAPHEWLLDRKKKIKMKKEKNKKKIEMYAKPFADIWKTKMMEKKKLQEKLYLGKKNFKGNHNQSA